jgi:hypothetical protein
MNVPRYGDWNGGKRRNITNGSQTARRAMKTSNFHGIVFCPWRGIHGEWSAFIPPDKTDQRSKRIVIGYYKKEKDAVEARRQAMHARHPNASDKATNRKRRRDERRKKNRMHTTKSIMRGEYIHYNYPIDSNLNDHLNDHLKKKYHPKFKRGHAWLPQQQEKARDRLQHKVDFHSGEQPPKHDDYNHRHHYKLPHIENTSLQMGHDHYSLRRKNGNKMFLRHNMLDMTQRQRYDRLDRERLRWANNFCPASYNNSFQRQHSWLPKQQALASFRKRQENKQH